MEMVRRSRIGVKNNFGTLMLFENLRSDEDLRQFALEELKLRKSTLEDVKVFLQSHQLCPETDTHNLTEDGLWLLEEFKLEIPLAVDGCKYLLCDHRVNGIDYVRSLPFRKLPRAWLRLFFWHSTVYSLLFLIENGVLVDVGGRIQVAAL